MTKTDNRPKEKMRLTIEFADNGIILRNPELEDEVTLAILGLDAGGYNVTHDEEYKAIGKKIYDWLTEVVVSEHAETWISTGAEIDITATMNGRPRE
jgi:hypothetical protein